MKKNFRMNRQIRRNYFECQKNQQWKNREKLRMKLDEAKRFADQIGLEITQVNVRRKLTGRNLQKSIDIIVSNRREENDAIDNRKRLLKCVFFKDKACISDKKYKMSRSILDFVEMPGINKVTTIKNKIDGLTELRTNTHGVYVNVLQKITTACKFFLKKKRKIVPNYSIEDQKFTIKISWLHHACCFIEIIVTRAKVNLLNLSFTIINDKQNCKTAFGNFILG